MYTLFHTHATYWNNLIVETRAQMGKRYSCPLGISLLNQSQHVLRVIAIE